MAHFKLVTQHLPEETDESQETLGKACQYTTEIRVLASPRGSMIANNYAHNIRVQR